jgi:hypothetical protein
LTTRGGASGHRHSPTGAYAQDRHACEGVSPCVVCDEEHHAARAPGVTRGVCVDCRGPPQWGESAPGRREVPRCHAAHRTTRFRCPCIRTSGRCQAVRGAALGVGQVRETAPPCHSPTGLRTGNQCPANGVPPGCGRSRSRTAVLPAALRAETAVPRDWNCW